jgi:hypothetical protein
MNDFIESPASVLQETCKHCGKPIKWDTTKKQWVEIIEGSTGIEQYCWIDMVQGSQLHHP